MAHISSSQFQSDESQALASYGDNPVAVMDVARFARKSPYILRPFAREEVIPSEGDDLSATLDFDVDCDELLDFAPILAIESSDQAVDRSYARGGWLDARRFG